MNPGSNLLRRAMRLLTKQTVAYYQFLSRTPNVNGDFVVTYATPINITGSFQAVPRQLYEKMGLLFQKTYFNFYTPNNLIDLERDTAGDQIIFDTERFQVESATDWFGVDGWKALLCVKIQGSVN